MKIRHALVAALLPAVFVAQAPAAGYDFENLPLGPMTVPQDNWTIGGNLGLIETGGGIDSSHVLGSVNDQGALYVGLIGTPVQNFGVPALKVGDRLLFAADFRIPVSPRTSEAGFSIGIGSVANPSPGNPGLLGLSFEYFDTYDRLLVQRFDGSRFSGIADNFPHNHGDWIHTEMLLDLTGPSALASFYTQDLTTGSALAPIPQIQNYDLNVPTSTLAGLPWNSVYIQVGNVQLDNLRITTVPEPATVSLLLAPAAALLLRRRAHRRHEPLHPKH